LGRRKALKGEARECRDLKEDPTDDEADVAERVAKPWERDFWKPGQGLSDASQKGAKKGFHHLEMLRGRRVQARCQIEPASVDLVGIGSGG
jgi:glycogen debranching enzyme